MLILCFECLQKFLKQEVDPDRCFFTEYSYYCQMCGEYRKAARLATNEPSPPKVLYFD